MALYFLVMLPLTIWLLALCWVWLIVGVVMQSWHRWLGAMALQLSLVTFAFGLLQGDVVWALTGALFPPLLCIVFDYYAKFETFFALIFPFAATAGAIVLTTCLAVPKWRLWCVAPTLLAAMIIGVWTGENVSQNAMCDTAATMGIKSFQRKSLAWSLANTPQDFQFGIHATAELDGQRLGWSYREMGWYVIRPDARGEVDAPVFDCSPWVFF